MTTFKKALKLAGHKLLSFTYNGLTWRFIQSIRGYGGNFKLPLSIPKSLSFETRESG
jgi:hypothetical protein